MMKRDALLDLANKLFAIHQVLMVPIWNFLIKKRENFLPNAKKVFYLKKKTELAYINADFKMLAFQIVVHIV